MEVIAEMCSVDTGAARTLQPGLEALSAADARLSDRSVVDSGVNTDEDWKEQIQTLLESGSTLSQEFNAMKLKQQQDELDFNKSCSDLQKRRDQAVRQHQALLEKLKSVRVKLELNNSKAARKNFLSKIQEMAEEKNRCLEEKARLGKELSEAEGRLSTLEREQEVERGQWEQDLSELRKQTEHAQKEAKDMETKALRDMRTALEKHLETSDEMVHDWLLQVTVYLDGLHVELPHRHHQEKAQWERRKASVRRSQTDLHATVDDLLSELDKRKLESLPPISLPSLPQVPMAELYFHRIIHLMPRPQTLPPVLTPPPVIVNPRGVLLPTPIRHAHFSPRNPQFLHQPLMVPLPCLPVTPLAQAAPPSQAPPVLTASYPDSNNSATSTGAGTVGPADAVGPSGAAAPTGAVGKLDKVLEKLGTHFPQCSRARLTGFLQQLKSERGTLAGLSMEDVVEQIRHRVEAPSVNQRPAAEASAPAAIAPRKPCLVCQKLVDPVSKFNLSCSHTVHKECIEVWLQSSKSNSCPFCPNK